jgi:aldehyde dehydrogenase (NAD+)
MGSYHGKAGFDAFSHTKSIVERNSGFDLPVRFAPYKDSAKKLLEKFLK